MPLSDFYIVLRWWGTLFLLGAAAFPITKRLFSSWNHQGYLFSKAVGMALVGWLVLVLGMARIAPFSVMTITISISLIFIVGLMVPKTPKEPKDPIWKTIIAEEVFFFLALLFWSWVKAHEPSIRGLEKFMDYGFMNSILHAKYFPAVDMWYPPETINYYYFGHLVTALLTKVSGLDLAYTFNLMLATIFAFTLTMSFSIGRELTRKIGGGLLTAFLVTLAGNMQTMYAFTKGYDGDKVLPFWQLFGKMDLARYWYANATRFIPYSIHEFPSYSFVVSDVHGHVLSIPFVLLAIALLLQKKISYIFYGFLCGVLLMTNALDGPIYFGLFLVLLFINRGSWADMGMKGGMVLGVAVITSLPFLAHFKSFVNGVALNCPPQFLANTKIGMLLFEGVEKCQRSPFWMLWILWGFFWFCGGAFLLRRIGSVRAVRDIRGVWEKKFTQIEKVLVVFFVVSLALIIFPEFFYFKDIYPQHFRSNTMFKLGYQAFILFSIVSAYAIMSLLRNKLFVLLLLPQLFLVSIYPIFSVRSYFNSLRTYEGVYGLNWLALQYPNDYAGITWLNGHVPKSILIEADGDSYTDYQRYSVFVGMPTPIGWGVHEWLWRGSYDVVAPRREDVRKMYESEDLQETRDLLHQYAVRYIIVGALEREKFIQLQEWKFVEVAKKVFEQGDTIIYETSN